VPSRHGTPCSVRLGDDSQLYLSCESTHDQSRVFCFHSCRCFHIASKHESDPSAHSEAKPRGARCLHQEYGPLNEVPRCRGFCPRALSLGRRLVGALSENPKIPPWTYRNYHMQSGGSVSATFIRLSSMPSCGRSAKRTEHLHLVSAWWRARGRTNRRTAIGRGQMVTD
jgi:hypothetical protein